MRNLIWLFIALLVVACGAQATPPPTAIPPTDTPAPPTASPLPPTATPLPPTPASIPATPTPKKSSLQGGSLSKAQSDLFSASGLCVTCHADQVDEAKHNVSIDAQWRGNMLANAARDPYYLATVRSEVNAAPALASVIEDKCATCHMPMARTAAAAAKQPVKMLGDGFTNDANPLNGLAMDGVSCALCHQIGSSNLGQKSSFSGGFAVDTTTPRGQRNVLGPYDVDPDAANAMRSMSGYGVVRDEKLNSAEACATCHNLYTPYVDAAGKIAGEFPEQMPYSEWLASDYKQGAACNDCHMPPAQGKVLTSSLAKTPRAPFSQHTLAGGNVFMLRILQAFGDDLKVTASGDNYEAAIGRTTEFMQKSAAKLSISDARISEGKVVVTVIVEPQTGHKFPTAFPSRRAWLHVTIKDAAGKVVFESGAFTPDGSIMGNDNDADPAKFEPHYMSIARPDQVQIYESIMKDTDGKVTTELLRGAAYVKDNRLLPKGFDKAAVSRDIGVFGEAAQDKGFRGGFDDVIYAVNPAGAAGPYTFTAELLYQSVGYRWIENLRGASGDEVTRFLSYVKGVPNTPVVVATASTTVK